MLLKGIGVSNGIGIGKVLILQDENFTIPNKKIEDTTSEIERFKNAITTSKKEIQCIHKKTIEKMGPEHGQIFEAHLLILEDPQIAQSVTDKINNDKINAEFALKEVSEQFISMFKAMDNEYMRERAADIEDVTSRIMNHLMGIKSQDISSLDEKMIIIGNDIAPSQTATMDKDNVLGFITEMGGPTSHTAIMARILGIPAIVGVKNICSTLKNDDIIILDGSDGTIIINPSEDELSAYKLKQEEFEKEQEELKTLINEPATTIDGHNVHVVANIGGPNDLDAVISNGAEGVGLFRTEFLYMDSAQLPTEDEQFEAYKKVVEGMNGKEVIIRTLDIGGDKELDALKLPKEMNPFLGYRAIRICLNDIDLFKPQVRALLRASYYGKLKILLPMISDVNQVKAVKSIMEDCKAELDKENIPYNDNIEIGVMIEIPAAAIISDLLAKEVDFFSIGTNDLIQYTIAVDRMNENISDLYDPSHVAVIRLIKMVVENAHKENVKVGMCGEMAGDLNFIPLLVALGLDELSMSPSSILPAKKLIRSLKLDEIKELATNAAKL